MCRLQGRGELGRTRSPLHIFSSEIPAWFGGDGRGAFIWMSAVSEATFRKKTTVWRVGIRCSWKLLRERHRKRCCFLGDFHHDREAPTVLAALWLVSSTTSISGLGDGESGLILLPCCGSSFPSREECPSLCTQDFLSSQ